MLNTMLAGVFAGEGLLEIQERRIPSPQSPDDVLIEVEACGLCGTDLQILAMPPGHKATPGIILGHEFLGEVITAGANVKNVHVGDRVAVDPNLKCELCRYCRWGMGNQCENWTTMGIFLDGGFTRYVVAPQRALYPISKLIPFEDAVWTEVLSCVTASIDRIAIRPGKTAVVIGAGPIGILHGMLFKVSGARVIISDISQMRLEMAAKTGLETVNVKDHSLAEIVKDLTHGMGADVAVDAVGTQVETCLNVVGKCGLVSIFGSNEKAKATFQQEIIQRNEITIFGTYVGRHVFPRAIQLLEQGVVKPSVLISHLLPVGQLLSGVEAARRGEAMKVVIRP